MNQNYVVIVDNNDNILGTELREIAHRKGRLHRVVVVYLTSPQGKILMQMRTDGRLDHSCAGHVDPRESYQDAARRELIEELNYNVEELVEVGTTFSRTHFYKIYKTIVRRKIDKTHLNKEEVRWIRWVDPVDTLHKMSLDKKNKIFTSGFKATLKVYLNKD